MRAKVSAPCIPALISDTKIVIVLMVTATNYLLADPFHGLVRLFAIVIVTSSFLSVPMCSGPSILRVIAFLQMFLHLIAGRLLSCCHKQLCSMYVQFYTLVGLFYFDFFSD